MYTSDTYLHRYGEDRSGGDPSGFSSLGSLDKMVDAFAVEMKKKLRAKFLNGYTGWDNPNMLLRLHAKLKAHAYKPGDQSVDIANLAAMIWNIENNPSPILDPPPPTEDTE